MRAAWPDWLEPPAGVLGPLVFTDDAGAFLNRWPSVHRDLVTELADWPRAE